MVHAGKTVQGWNHRGPRDIECLYCEVLSHSTTAYSLWMYLWCLYVLQSIFSFHQSSVMHKIVEYFNFSPNWKEQVTFWILKPCTGIMLSNKSSAFPDRTGTNVEESIILAHCGQPKKINYCSSECALFTDVPKNDKRPGRIRLNLYPKWCYLALPAKSFIKRSIQTFISGVFKKINDKLAYILGCWRKQSILQ